VTGKSDNKRNPGATRAALIAAARLEFEESGFDSTQSNKIARRAGFAPQTFYRHFADKIEVLLAVYERWMIEEQEALNAARGPRQVARTLLAHHRSSLKFRRALRTLTVTDARVRAARADSRRAQIERLKRLLPQLAKVADARLARGLLVIERIADACSEGEFLDLQVSAEAAEAQLMTCLEEQLMLSPRRAKPA
jgi:AcrR family transcriptional regulator